MSKAEAKTIRLLLNDGDLDGIIRMQDSKWNAGALYSAPRACVDELINDEACKNFGVYLLLSSDMVYVGQSTDLAKRINQHKAGKDWWDRVILLTTSDNSLTHTDIDYLETFLIDKASKNNVLDCDNKQKGNPPKVDLFRKVELDQFIEEALFLLQLIGITIFCDSAIVPNSLLSIDSKTKLKIGKNAKGEAIKYLNAKGISVSNSATYAYKNDQGDYFWANPQVKLLQTDWTIVLNDTISSKLILMRVPAETLRVKDQDSDGLKVRTDKPNMIDLRITRETYEEINSGIDFSVYVEQIVKY